MIRVADNKMPGVRTFYVPSRSEPGTEHICQYVRRGHRCRWYCTCKDFTFRKLPKTRHCDHLKELVQLSKAAGGVVALVKRIQKLQDLASRYPDSTPEQLGNALTGVPA